MLRSVRARLLLAVGLVVAAAVAAVGVLSSVVSRQEFDRVYQVSIERIDGRIEFQPDIELVEHFKQCVLYQDILDDKSQLRDGEFRSIESQSRRAVRTAAFVPDTHALVGTGSGCLNV